MTLADILDKDVKKHVAAIHTDAKLSLLQRKMSNVLLLNAYPHLLNQETHRIRVKELAEVVGFDSNDRKCLQDALLGLMKTVFKWNVIKKKGVETDWDACVMIYKASMKGAWCTYCYSPDLREKLYQPQIYAQINMSIQRNFTSGYALALYENCLSYRGAGETPWWSIQEVRQVLGLGDSAFYQEYRVLNRKVLKPALKQVNDTSDILLELAPVRRERRRIVALKFLIRDNPQGQLFRPGETERSEEVAHPLFLEEEDKTKAFRERMQSFGLTNKQIEDVLAAHDEAYIVGNLGVVERNLEAGKVEAENLAKYAYCALRDDYRPKDVPPAVKAKMAKQEAAKSQLEKRKATQKRLAQLETEFTAHRLTSALAELSDQERKQLEANFLESLEEEGNLSGSMVRKHYLKSGFASKIVQGHFRTYARKRILSEPTDHEFELFVNDQDENLPTLRAAL